MAISTAIDASAVARVTGIKTIFKNLNAGGVVFLPQRIIVVGQGASASVYSTVKAQITSALEAGQTYGFGSPIHLAVSQLLPSNGDGVGTIPVTVYALQDGGGAATAAGDITPAGAVAKAGAFTIKINNILSQQFVVAVGDTVAQIVTKMTAALNAVLEQPVIGSDDTTELGVTAKWAGLSGNDLVIEVDGPSDTGVTFGITQPVGGLVNPDVDVALDQIGGVWETMVLNLLDIADTNTLDKYATFNEGRWLPLVRKPLVVFSGNNEVDVATAIAVTDTRKTDRTNIQLVEPGSNDLPFVLAARQVARIAPVANNNPPHDYGSQQATGLTPGADGVQWDYLKRDTAVKGGSSTIQVVDGVTQISDVVTMSHPTGDPLPPYRFLVDIIKVWNVLFNIDLIFATPEWDGAPLIPDADPTVNATAKKPKTAVAAIAAKIDSLALQAILSDPATAKANTFAEIDAGNPKRLNAATTVQVSGNTNQKAIDLNWGFHFGTPTILA